MEACLQALPFVAGGMLVVNRVLNKMVMIPMAEHVLFLALFQAFFYVLVYGAILLMRRMTGQVNAAMVQLGRSMAPLFLIIGLCESLQLILFYTAASKLPGAVLPVLSQAGIVWNFILSALILKKAFTSEQLAGAALVVCGAAIVAGGKSTGAASVSILFSAIFVLSMLFPAISSTLKERIFIAARKKFDGQDLDVFVVNTCSSIAQAISLALLFPLILGQRGITVSSMPSNISAGWQAFTGVGMDGLVTLVPCIALIWNVAFNIAILTAVRSIGVANVVVALTAAVPVTVWVFTLPLPIIGSAPLPGDFFVQGTVLLMAGQVMYNLTSIRSALFGPSANSSKLA